MTGEENTEIFGNDNIQDSNNQARLKTKDTKIDYCELRILLFIRGISIYLLFRIVFIFSSFIFVFGFWYLVFGFLVIGIWHLVLLKF